MKKKLLSIILLSSIIVKSQDYQTVKSDIVYFFNKEILNAGDYARTIKIDSTHYLAGDSILFPNKNIQACLFPIEYDGYYTPYGASWIGEKVIIKPDGNNLFFNVMGDTISIQTKANLNETWLAYQLFDSTKIYATITNHDTLSYLGLTDSVKTISFQAFDNNLQSISHSINSKEILLSKHYGFISTFNYYLFPEYNPNYVGMLNDELQVCNLLGFDNSSIGINNLKWFEVFDFQVNDELHIDHLYPNPPNYIRDEQIYRYIGRQDYGMDSIKYTIEIEKLNIFGLSYPNFDTLYNIDTIVEVVYPNQNFDLLSRQAFLDTIWGNASFYSNLMSNDGLVKLENWNNEQFDSPQTDDSCYYNNGNFENYTNYEEKVNYRKGLGGPYYSYTTDNGVVPHHRQLVYYLKGTEEWGTPLNLVSSINEKRQNSEFTIFPNPASDYVVVVTNEKLQVESCEVLDLTGKLVKSFPFGETEKGLIIDISDLEQGIYIVKVGSQTHKFIIE
ncbi:MAG: T9SS type A sorting domain-containing protein [Bacteroidales bacterium]|nr:T9SS type A sorting domain-containing protein [Bacteroidales bacterium]